MTKTRNICSVPSCRNYGSYCRLHLNYSVPVATEIKKVSDNQKEVLKEYKKIRSGYLKAHPFCEASLPECSKVSVEIHHKAGKVGSEDYLNPAYYLSVCRKCHDIITANSAWAIKEGFSLSRLNKTA